MGLVVPFALAPLDVYPVIFFVCIIICNLLYVCPIKLIKKRKKNSSKNCNYRLSARSDFCGNSGGDGKNLGEVQRSSSRPPWKVRA